ncbi:MAG TPA: ABC transporter permease [Egibacteraceae bacterium]|nr:ABC transporter permease [Egibacteraceae bacterium]
MAVVEEYHAGSRPSSATAQLLDQELAGLDALDLPAQRRRRTARRVWAATWPKLAAVALGLGLWELVVLSGWKPEYVLPGPGPVLSTLWERLADGSLLQAAQITMARAVSGFLLAIVIGVAVGSAVALIKPLRVAVGSLLTGLQTMPSIAWFPLAILIFKLSEEAIMFVVVLGAAPAIANGLVYGADHIPPLFLRAGRVLGASGVSMYRHVMLPAILPSFVGGLKQGWAFAWRSLMAGELIVILANRPSIGVQLQFAREFSNARALLATMIVILFIGIVVDTLFFGTAERSLRRRWGLLQESA